MLTTTLDGLWVLQVLSGIESLAPELGLRPVLPSVESRDGALRHPIADELKAAGAINDAGEVDPVIVEWLTVLSRRDVALLLYMTTPVDSSLVGAMLARFSRWWVVIERAEAIVRIGPAGTATAEEAANALVRAQIERLLGANGPAPVRPVTLDATNLVARVKSPDSLRAFLAEQRLDPDQMRGLLLATDTAKSASASVVALQSGAEGAPGRVHVEHGSVTIYDTPEGRLLVEHAPHDGRTWMIVSPGSAANMTTAINGMLSRLPATAEWFSHRRIV